MDLVEQYLFLAAIVAMVIGSGKAFITMVVVQEKLWSEKAKPDDARKAKEWVRRTIFEGMLEMAVGTFVVLILLVWPGVLDNQGRQVAFVLGIVFLLWTVAIVVVSNRFLRDLKPTLSTADQ